MKSKNGPIITSSRVKRVMPVRKKSSFQISTLPGRQWFYRASILVLVTVGLALMIMHKSGNPAVVRLKTHLMDAAMPVLAVVASPFDAIADAGAWISEMAHLRAENVELKNQNVQLLKWQQAAKEMEAENRALKSLLGVVPSTSKHYITARVVSDLGGPYVHSALINAGGQHGIAKDQAVINEQGLVGRVIEAGDTSARVLLLSDMNSRVPVMTEITREKAMLMGTNEPLPVLSYLAAQSKVTVGERVVTSGDGGIFPRGIPVGMVVGVDKGVVTVQPFVDAVSIELVSVIQHAL